MLESLVKVGAVAQFADHGDGVLQRQKHTGMNRGVNTRCSITEQKLPVVWLTVEYMFGVTGKTEEADCGTND